MPKIHVNSVFSGNDRKSDTGENGYTSWSDFTESTSLHGIKHAFSPGHSQLRRFIWLISVLGMAAVLIYFISQLAIDYYKYPLTTSVTIQVKNEVDFPQVTICNISPFNANLMNINESISNLLLNLSPLKFASEPFDIESPDYNFTNTQHDRQYYHQISNQIGTSFLFCVFERSFLPCTEFFETKVTDMGLCFTTKMNTTAGHDLRSTRMTGSGNGFQLYVFADQNNYVHNVQLAAGFKVFLHDPHEQPDVSGGFLVSPGFATYANVRKIKYRHLAAPFKAFGEVECLDTKDTDFNNPLDYSDQYDLINCYKECRTKYIYKACGCLSYTDFVDFRLCTYKEVYNCYQDANYEFSRNTTELCKCGTPCEFVRYEAQISTAYVPSKLVESTLSKLNFVNIRDNYAELRIFYDQLVQTEIHHHKIYTFENILATLGGQMGFLLGASVLTISEFLEFICIKLCSFMCLLGSQR